MHILFVDDSRATALPLIAFLQQEGHRVSFVQDGRAAVEAYQAEPPDLVLMDIVMPEMDGIEATRRIKALSGTRWVPVMLMTALSAKEEIVAGLDAGADDYLIKPISFEVLDARLRSMQRIATMQDSLFAILDNVFEAILTIDEAGIVQSYNKAAERIFGYTAAEMIGANVKILMPSPYAEEHDGYLARYLQERAPRAIGDVRKAQGRRKDGEIFPIRLALTEIRRPTGSLFIGLIGDISDEEAARERIEFLALNDMLTGLPNRAQFTDEMDALLKTPGASTHALLFIDLDDFKPINDILGHEAGDEALRIVARRLRHSLAASDFIARLGGDEFVAIVRDVDGPEAALKIAGRLFDAACLPMVLNGTERRMGASIGIAMIPQHGTNAAAILTAADNAMYAAKRAGRGRIMVAGTEE
ncbi:MAG: diguanylate cyclase [Gammaproteobacteria bacterium]|nr:diguanylate cyclase [Rhodocyclaceae bacterium]MBU3910221.1 diguanylate cyclase [Gammaproteobacteria bacterium]MBU3988807.1 diguanylate cyclase [Gammaproteobacteria bacterium]MBU4004480.1 diguanylate cyclase [Gammaproteobacteria bacterium]MBU4022683.1 diguanylate cyclase [Gammaproteobacteria bacterium]